MIQRFSRVLGPVLAAMAVGLWSIDVRAQGTAPADGSVPGPTASPAGEESRERASYEELLRRLESLEKAEAERAAAPSRRPLSSAAAFIQNRFNPDISIVTDVALAGASDEDEAVHALGIPGLLNESNRWGKSRGFNFNYLELAFNAAVDPYFDFAAVAAFGAEEIAVEEAYVDSRRFPVGLQLRLGKFLSSFGRLNGMHKHAWDFYDPPLIFEALLGGEGLKNPGARVSWTAPVDFLLQANLEVFKGDFDESRTFNAVGYELTAADGTTLSGRAPSLSALSVGSLRTSVDVDNHVLLVGGSVMVGHSTQASVTGSPEDMAFSAPRTLLYDAELTYKYLLSSYRSITWQTEYIGRRSSGELALASDAQVHRAEKSQAGLYSQVVWRFDDPGQWRVGARVDLITQNSVSIDGEKQPLDEYLSRYTAMLEYSPSEFARFRLQYDFDRSRYSATGRRDVHDVILNVNVAVGPHGAHSF